jgi:hypothetical protein
MGWQNSVNFNQKNILQHRLTQPGLLTFVNEDKRETLFSVSEHLIQHVISIYNLLYNHNHLKITGTYILGLFYYIQILNHWILKVLAYSKSSSYRPTSTFRMESNPRGLCLSSIRLYFSQTTSTWRWTSLFFILLNSTITHMSNVKLSYSFKSEWLLHEPPTTTLKKKLF